MSRRKFFSVASNAYAHQHSIILSSCHFVTRRVFCRMPEFGDSITLVGRSDNGSEFTSSAVKDILRETGVDTLFLEPGSPWENGYVESLNARMRNELLNGEIFLSLDEMRYVVNRWRMDYNHYRPHSSLRYMTPVEFAQLCHDVGCIRPQKNT